MTRQTTLPRFPFAHTFSIVARDPVTCEMGVAVQSHWFSTGSIVTWAEAGVGVIATQAMVEVSYGPKGMAGMRQGVHPQEVLNELLRADEGSETRQVAFLDNFGRVAVHTGERCISEAGHQIGDQFAVQANMMLKNTVWPAMAKAYETAQGTLAERMMAALDAAQTESGDIRGMQSAAMLVVTGKTNTHPWTETVIDLRVEDHPQPLKELRRLLTLQGAYESMNRGDALLSTGKVKEALQAYKAGTEAAPEVKELSFWQAVTLADTGHVTEALPLFRKVFAENPNWAILFSRLPAAGLFKDDQALLQQILAVAPKHS